MRSKPEEFVLPEWVFQLVRTPLNFLWRGLFKIRYKGTENIPERGGLIVAANHQTYIDPFWLSIPIKRPLRFLAWDAAFDWPLVGKLIELFGAWPLQIEGSDPAAIRRTLQWLRAGEAVVIFPEGGRGRPDGSMLRFKGGAVRLALEADVPILPVTIRGAHRVWPAGQPIPSLGTVVVTYHPLFRVNQKPGEETRACARRESDRLAAVIQSAL
ncbi:MAG: 1-acyl-sn-glycerol-3-phosphate acyltransferase [Acidobacteria bacterium]|nr:1-acyl-sn-glycerol-3-phosphate acyltransferase [Acidobacteriota bacterium]